MQTRLRGSAVVQTKCQNGKKCDLSDFDRGMIVDFIVALKLQHSQAFMREKSNADTQHGLLCMT